MSDIDERLKRLEETLGVKKKRKQVIIRAHTEEEAEAKKAEARKRPENKNKELDFLVIMYVKQDPNNPPAQNKDLLSTN